MTREQDKRERHLWAAAWTQKIGEIVGGLSGYERQEVYMTMHRLRQSIESGRLNVPLVPAAQPGLFTDRADEIEAAE